METAGYYLPLIRWLPLTTDGLLVINNDAELMCLSPEGGDTRWPNQATGPITLDHLRAVGQRLPYIRSIVDGDTVIYQSLQGIVAFNTAPSLPGDQMAWYSSLRPPFPNLQNMQISDPYIVCLGRARR